MICVFFFNDTATTEIYTLSLHDALPISGTELENVQFVKLYQNAKEVIEKLNTNKEIRHVTDRKSTRLNSSHANISYAVFCLKKKTALNISNLPQLQLL